MPTEEVDGARGWRSVRPHLLGLARDRRPLCARNPARAGSWLLSASDGGDDGHRPRGQTSEPAPVARHPDLCWNLACAQFVHTIDIGPKGDQKRKKSL